MTTPTPNANTGKDRVFIFDTTMRDGEQSPGASMTIREKLELAELLQEMKVDICEAGFAASSEGDFQCVSQIAELAKDMAICTLARSTLTDIDRAGEALRNAKRPRIHTFISTSPVHMKHKLQMEPERVLEGHVAPVGGLAARGGALASAGWDGTVRLWDLAAGTARILDRAVVKDAAVVCEMTTRKKVGIGV